MRSGTAEERLADPPTVAAQYETLRMAALGEPLPPEARSGLGLFLRRGMWAWARALTAAPVQPTRSPWSSPTTPQQHRAVIQLFAAMVLKSNHGRVQ